MFVLAVDGWLVGGVFLTGRFCLSCMFSFALHFLTIIYHDYTMHLVFLCYFSFYRFCFDLAEFASATSLVFWPFRSSSVQR